MAKPSSAAPISAPAPSQATPVEQILFHVRFIDQWRVSASWQSQRFAFVGLELELHGQNGVSPASTVLDFSSQSNPSHHDALRRISGPFQVMVVAKMPLEAASDQQKALLQLTLPVQVQNQLARVNKVHFLKSCASGADVHRELKRVLDLASVARPCELTFLRHNHAQAAAKIRPFAARADVQKAQVAQFQNLQEEESKWPDERRKRKQFVLQQLDFYREQYLYDYIGGRLQTLHEEIMGGGQWHAYEFEKALWYYHAPTGELIAEHPMRNNEKTRELIGSVQLRTRMAAQKLQHGTRAFLRRNRLINAATGRLLEAIVNDIWATSVDTASVQATVARAQTANDKLLETIINETWTTTVETACAQVAEERAQAATERILDSIVHGTWTISVDAALTQAAAVRAEAASERLLEAIVNDIWNTSVDAACVQAAAERAQAATKKLQSATATTAKVRGLLGKFMPRKVVTNEAIEEPAPVAAEPAKEPTVQEESQPPPADVELATTPVTITVIEPEVIHPPPRIDSLSTNAALTQATAASRPVSAIENVSGQVVVDIVQAVPPPEPLLHEEPEWCEPETPVPAAAVLPEPLQSSTSFNVIPTTPDQPESVVDDFTASRYVDDDDEDMVTNWRSQLRLLKAHYQERRVSPKRMKAQKPGPHSTVIVGHGSRSFSSTIEPALHDRSASLLLDLSIDGPVSPGLLTSLKEPKQRSDGDNWHIESPPWRRDGSFRSFHDFFTGSTSPEARCGYPSGNLRLRVATRYDCEDERENAGTQSLSASTKLPKLGPPAPLVTQPPPAALLTDSKVRGNGIASASRANVNEAASRTGATAMQSSPPKKLPYIRRRKR